jgi:hypothetical protein
MVEYGQGVGQGTGLGGTNPGTSGTQDLGAGVGAFISDTVDTVSALPPEMLVVIAVVILVGLIVLRRAF